MIVALDVLILIGGPNLKVTQHQPCDHYQKMGKKDDLPAYHSALAFIGAQGVDRSTEPERSTYLLVRSLRVSTIAGLCARSQCRVTAITPSVLWSFLQD